ncbi:MAG: decaprenyl-phosphate phosphoribosyltransferase [Myxococcota bacterium]
MGEPSDQNGALEPSFGSEPPPSTGGPVWRALGGLKTMRPHQWVKNVFVLAPVFFAKDFFHEELLIRAFGAFGVFCLLASAVYTINDLVDVEADRAHPVKRFRPIASGRFPPKAAKVLAVALVVVSLAGAAFGPLWFFVTAAAYFVLNLAYSFKLKKVAYIDVSCIAAGFVLRVVGGGFAAGIHVSWYLIVCTALLALFLGFGKRRHELAQSARKNAKTRAALDAYTPRALTIALALTATATVVTYAAYTLDPKTEAFFRSEWLWLTTPFTVFGVVRFLQLMAGRPKAESPTQEMLRDTLFVLNLVVWAIVVFAIVYRLRPEVGP